MKRRAAVPVLLILGPAILTLLCAVRPRPAHAAGAVQEPEKPAGTEGPPGAPETRAPDAAPPTGPAGRGPQAMTDGEEPFVVSLTDALNYSLQNNLEIAVRRYDPIAAEARLMNFESVFDPLLTGTARSGQSQDRQIFFRVPDLTDRTHEYTVRFEDPLPFGGRYGLQIYGQDTTSTAAGTTTDRSFFTSWEVSYRQSLLRGLGYDANRWQILVAKSDVGVNQERFRQGVLDALSATEKAYWDLVFALMDLKTKRDSLKLAQDFLEQNRIKVRVGTLAPIEITQAEAGVADREEGVIVGENAVRTAEDALRRVVNLPKDSPLWSRPLQPSDSPTLTDFVADIDGAVTVASQNRPDLQQARLAVKSREDEVLYRRNQTRWGLDLDAAYGALGFAADQQVITTSGTCAVPSALTPGDCLLFDTDRMDQTAIASIGSYSDSFDDLEDRDKINWRVQMMLSIPIGNRLAKAGLNESEARLSQARYEEQRLQQNAWVEVRNAVRQVETNLKRTRSAQVNVRLQREKLSAEQKKFENGMSTSFQVLQFQTDLSSAESRENLAIVDFSKSLVELERVKGTLLEARRMVLPEAGPQESRSGRLRQAAALESAAIRLPTDFIYDGRSLHAVAIPDALRALVVPAPHATSGSGSH